MRKKIEWLFLRRARLVIKAVKRCFFFSFPGKERKKSSVLGTARQTMCRTRQFYNPNSLSVRIEHVVDRHGESKTWRRRTMKALQHMNTKPFKPPQKAARERKKSERRKPIFSAALYFLAAPISGVVSVHWIDRRRRRTAGGPKMVLPSDPWLSRSLQQLAQLANQIDTDTQPKVLTAAAAAAEIGDVACLTMDNDCDCDRGDISIQLQRGFFPSAPDLNGIKRTPLR